MLRRIVPLVATALMAASAQTYDGPRPPKPDVPFLKHASSLVATEVGEAKEEKQKSAAFLEQAAKEPGAQKTPSGLIYIEKQAGTGESPKPTDMVKVHYRGTLPDGKEIKGIYEMDGDTLKSCVAPAGKERPKEFSAGKGTGHTLRVFKRMKE